MALITITRQMGSGGTEIARLVAEGLNLELYDDARLQKEAIDKGLKSEDLKGFDEKAPGFFDRIMNRKPEAYLDLMEAVVYEVAQKGEGVIIGHGSQMLLRDFGCALHVRIHATEGKRIQNVMESQKLSRQAAEKLVIKADRDQTHFFRFAFPQDNEERTLYDVMVNTEKLSEKSAAKLIMEASWLNEISTCSLTALDAMEKLAQVKKIEAALLKEDIDLSMLFFDVPEKGIAEIHGLVHTQELKDRVVSIIQEVPDINEVQSEIVVKNVGLLY